MKTMINTKKHGIVEFFSMGSGGYVWTDLEGQGPGTMGLQICAGGRLSGSTLSYYGGQSGFAQFCRRWWASYLRNNR